jgi:tetratricopeptide (TPR) repeat protein
VNHLKKAVLLLGMVTVAMAQSSAPPISDTRIPVHTLLREDIFAGFLSDDMDRFARGEKNIELLMEQRPADKSSLLAWKGGAVLYRAVRAYEEKKADEFQQKYQKALEYFKQAKEADPNNFGVNAIVGGTFAVFGDRLPKDQQSIAWSRAFDEYQVLWKVQGSAVARLPVHLKGELLAGLTQSAQRTGRTQEFEQYLDKMLEVLKDTPYEPVAKRWKANPAAAKSGSITCLSCHDQGRLSARMSALGN